MELLSMRLVVSTPGSKGGLQAYADTDTLALCFSPLSFRNGGVRNQHCVGVVFDGARNETVEMLQGRPSRNGA